MIQLGNQRRAAQKHQSQPLESVRRNLDAGAKTFELIDGGIVSIVDDDENRPLERPRPFHQPQQGLATLASARRKRTVVHGQRDDTVQCELGVRAASPCSNRPQSVDSAKNPFEQIAGLGPIGAGYEHVSCTPSQCQLEPRFFAAPALRGPAPAQRRAQRQTLGQE